MENTVVGIGEILWDVYPNGKVLGGAPANFVYHVSQFGFNGYAVSAVGKDILGNEIADSLNKKELKCILQKTSEPTGTVQVTIDNNGEPHYEICKNVAWDNLTFNDELKQLAKRTNTICFGSLAQRNSVSAKAIGVFLDYLPTDALKIFDINLRQDFYNKKLIDSSLNRCNILKINNEELVTIAELFGWVRMNEMEICDTLIKNYSLKILILTKGVNGSYVMTHTEKSFKQTPEVQVVDTVGAGDSFTAAFVAALLKKKSISEAHQLAVDVAAFVCTQKGAMPFLPDSIIERV